MANYIIALYCLISDFCKIYHEWEKQKLIPTQKQRERQGNLTLAELLTIVLYFYFSKYMDFKSYYLTCLPYKYKGYFNLPSYSRIIQLMPRLMLPLTILIHCLRGEETGIYYIDSTKLAICHNKRTKTNRVFGKIARIGKSSYGWFMGFKLHLIINNKGEVMAVKITKGNKSDLSVTPSLITGLRGKLFGDKAYISNVLFDKLFAKGLRLFSTIRKNMKNYFLDLEDKKLLKKRSLIESVFNVLKNQMNLEHTRHRSPINFLVHILACVGSYMIKKLGVASTKINYSSLWLS